MSTKSSFYRLFAAICFALLWVGCDSDPLPAEGASSDVIGYVHLVEVTGQLALSHAGATVTVEGTSYSAVTDSSGRYVLSHVPSGTYTLVFTKPGYGSHKLYN